MKSILVVSADAGQTERVKAALTVQGLWVAEVADRQVALRAAADQAPNLVLVDGDLPGASDLVRTFCQKNGGPGVLVLAGHDSAPAVGEADGWLPHPLDHQEMVRSVQRLLAAPRAQSAETQEKAGATARRFSAQDIFGDILREVEGREPVPPPPRPAAVAPATDDAAVAPAPEAAAPAPEVAVSAPEGEAPAPDGEAPELPPLVPPPAIVPDAAREGVAEEPHRFGHYELEERIAVGGMAEIWKARMTGVEGFEKTVAIKKILPHLTESEDFEKMFVEEAKLAARLNHENIIHIYDLGRISGQYFIAMEYVEGKDLRSILNTAMRRGERLPLPLALLVGARLASALDYAHRRPDSGGQAPAVIHRDVSPRNVLVGYDGRIKLCDFGVAKLANQVGRTKIGAIKGKIQYMSPEQAWGQPVDRRSDVFSLAVVLFEIITGQRLFAGDSEISLLDAVRECITRAPRDVDPEIPEALDRVIVRALSKNPDQRHQSAGELQRELEDLLYSQRPAPGAEELARYLERLYSAEPMPPSAAPLPPAVAAPALAASVPEAPLSYAPAGEPEAGAARLRRRRLMWGLVAALLLIALLVAAWWRWGGPTDAGEARSPDDVAAEPEVVEPAASAMPALEGSAGEVPAEGATPLPPEAAADEEQARIEEMVNREMLRREAELRQLFEQQQERLQRELDELRAAPDEQADEDDGGGGSGG